MYLPPQFAAKDAATAIDLMRAHPFASLISVDDDGLPFVTHLPLHLEQRGDDLVLLGPYAWVAPGYVPVGFTNPVWLDADGDGVWTPGG